MKGKIPFLIFVLTVAPQLAESTEMDHRFINPNFGGNPLNGPVLLNSANAQNFFKAPSTASTTSSGAGSSAKSVSQSALNSFKTQLESMVLNKLALEITNQLFPSNGSTSSVQTGTYNFGDYVVTISNATGGLNVNVSDVVAGTSTNITIPTTLPSN